MSVDKFGRTGTNYTSGVHHVGNFLPLTGGRLGGTLTMGANNIQFSTGDIHSAEDLSFLINSETKMVLRPNGVNVCDGKISNVALPTLASDAANKSYVDSEVQTFAGRFLPLTGGSLSGNLALGSNNIEFSTGDILSQEDLSFIINREAKLAIRENAIDACNKKLINIALPTLAADAANKSYVDSEVQTFAGRFLPLTGGSLSGNLSLGSNNIEFSTGYISCQEDLSFIINRQARFVITETGLNICNNKLINVAPPTLATDAVNKTYVDSEVLEVRQVHRHAVDSCAESAISARVSQEDSERFANDAKTHANRAATISTSAAPANPLQDNTYLLTFRNSAQTWTNADSWINQLTNTNLLMAGTRYLFVYDTTANSFQRGSVSLFEGNY